MSGDDDVAELRRQVEELAAERDVLTMLLEDTEEYLQHRPNCAWVLSKRPCDCGLVELQTRVHAELELEENGDEDEEDEDDDVGTPATPAR